MDVSTLRPPDHEMYKLYPYKFKLLSTVCCFFVYINSGLFNNLPSVVIIDMTYLIGTTMVISSNGITVRGFFYAISSLTCELN